METKFEAGNVYAMKTAYNADQKIEMICTKVTKCYATFEHFQRPDKETLRLKKFVFNGVERVRNGNYTGADYICAGTILH